MPLTIYHNPRCSKSLKTLEIIQESGVDPTIVEYLDNPPSGQRIIEIAALLGVAVQDLLRRNETEFKEAADLPELSNDAALADWVSRNPRVLERPIVVTEDGRRAVVGRPPENVTDLLG